MDGAGHFPMWGKEKKDDKQAKARARANKQKQKKPSAAIAKIMKDRGLNKKNEDDIKPSHFDITVFQKTFKRFIICDGQIRSQTRELILKDLNKTMTVFIDDFKE